MIANERHMSMAIMADVNMCLRGEKFYNSFLWEEISI